MNGLEWRHLKGLNQIYESGQTRLKISSSDFISHILMKQKKLVRPKSGNHEILEKILGFDAYFEKELLETYRYYNTFFTEAGIDGNARKTFSEEDIKTLIFIYNGRSELKKSLTTEYTFSAQIFKKGSKYLTNKPSLKNAVLQLLEIKEFPEKDPKNNLWRFIIDCQNPKVIVLCENINCLRVPFEYKANGIELWYVGGNNTAPLLDITAEKLNLPIYYFGDWDYNGLMIYSRVKAILKKKNTDVTLITPNTLENSLPTDSKHHKSKWKLSNFSGLTKTDYNDKQITIINTLVENNKWIEEESMDLIRLLKMLGQI